MEYVIVHHGIKGQKWGVRRFQNADGSLTDAGKKRYSTGETNSKSGSGISKETVKKIAIGVGVTAVVGAGVYAYAKNPVVRDAVDTAITKLNLQSALVLSAAKANPSAVVALGKEYLKKASATSVGKGFVKVGKGAAEGAAIIAARKMLEGIVGEENADATIRAYNAYNKKNKIGNINDLVREKDKDDEDD